MKAGSVIKYRLANFAGVTAIVGASPNDRIYPVVLPQDPVLPAIAYRQIAGRRLRGTNDDPGVAEVTVQVTAFARTCDEAKSLAEQIRIALERYGTAVTGTSINGVTVYDIVMGSDADDYVPEIPCFAVATDFTVTHLE